MKRLMLALLFFVFFVSCGGEEETVMNELNSLSSATVENSDIVFPENDGEIDPEIRIARMNAFRENQLKLKTFKEEEVVMETKALFGTNSLYFFDFDDSEQGWTTGLYDDPNGTYESTVLWTRKSDIAGIGLGSNAMVDQHTGTYVHNWMKSPVLDFSGSVGVSLYLRVWQQDEDSYYTKICYGESGASFDQKDLRICEDDGMGGVINCEVLSCSFTNDGAWHEYVFDLSGWDNRSNVVLMFRYNTIDSLYGNGWAVDDVQITKLCTENPTPEPTDVTVDTDYVCSGTEINLNATTENGAMISWYTTPVGGKSLGTSNSGEDFSVSPTVTTTYYAEAKLPDVVLPGEETFNYTGAVQEWIVPEGVTSIEIEAWGAQGGLGGTTNNIGGLGGFSKGTLAVVPGQVLNIYVGGKGSDRALDSSQNSPGGFNGGGAGGFDNSGQYQNGGGGGGATDIRIGSEDLSARIIVAGGGGGGGGGWFAANGGEGGGLEGGTGEYSYTAKGGTGGTQTEGGTVDNFRGATNGSLGMGGNGSTNLDAWGSGGGGAGYYGGAGGTSMENHGSGYAGAGGGGSSYIDGVLNGETTAGVRTGNGEIKITYTAAIIYCPSNRVPVEVKVDPLSVGGMMSGTTPIVYGAAENLSLIGYTGSILQWERKYENGEWEVIVNTSATYTDNPDAVGTWYYRALVKSGLCSQTYSSEFILTVNKASLTVTADNKSKVYGDE